jgi:hypothetical protein
MGKCALPFLWRPWGTCSRNAIVIIVTRYLPRPLGDFHFCAFYFPVPPLFILIFALSLFSRHDHNDYDEVVSLLEGADE